MKANEITTLNQLADFINSKEDFPLEAFDIIKRNGWIDESHEEWRVCSSDTERIVFNDDTEAIVVPKEITCKVFLPHEERETKNREQNYL